MDSNQILKSDFNDILFEGRNKAYGAYELRKEYNKRMGIATLAGVLFLSLSVFAYKTLTTKKVETKKKVLKEVTLGEAPPMDENTPPPPPPPPPPPDPVRAEVKFVPPKIEKDEKVVVNEIKEQKEMEKTDIGTKDVKGQNDAELNADDIVVKKKEEEEKKVEKKDNVVHEAVDEDPVYPGGDDAILAFLAENIKYPKPALDANAEGTVQVQFVVMEDGSVSNVRALNKLGYGLEDEARRVISRLKNFKSPGKIGVQPVKSYYTVPVKFSIE